jgi:cobalamin biosynthetic protein CobC
MTARLAHGGRLDAARRFYPTAPLPWVDLSTGVNPHPYPLPAIPPEAWTRLPDDDASEALRRAAHSAFDAPQEAGVVAGPGVQAFIQLVPRLVPARRVAVLGATYAEHAACWRAAGASIDVCETLDALADAAADVVVIVNPNNPDGRLVSLTQLSDIAARTEIRGGLVVVDESFMDFTPEHSFCAQAARPGVLVLRSFGKAYGLPGLRLGFALCASRLAATLEAGLGPWAVSGPALFIGTAALSDHDWRTGAMEARAADAVRLDALLRRAGFGIVGGVSLFRLARHPEATLRFEKLCADGVLTRAFDERLDVLRFGLPGSELAWRRVTEALGRL